MIIGFDGKRAVANMTGLGNYSRLVLERLADEFPHDSLLVYTPEMRHNPRLTPLKGLHNVEFRLPPPQGFKGSLWRTFGISNNLKADKVDVFHGLSNELPLNIRKSGVPSVVTIHDVIYRHLKNCYKPIDRMLYDYKYGHSCRNADRVIAVSERTKQDVVEFYGVDPDRIDVIYQGCDNSFRRLWDRSEIDALRRRLALPERYILQVGTIEKRKNLELTVRALSSLPSEIHLVAVGKDHHGYKKEVEALASRMGIASRIHYYEGIDFKDLPGLNQAAEAVVYPSRYEGFGIPVLEALESMRPVVAATGSCLEEAGGLHTIYVGPDCPRDMAAALRGIIDGSVDTATMIAEGKRHAARFGKETMSTEIRYTYSRAIDEWRKRNSRDSI